MSPEKQVICYASPLGGCSDTQSREHIFTQGLFPEKIINVEGHDWLDGKVKAVSKRTLGVPILCTKHNSALSPLDRVPIRFFRDWKRMLKSSDMRVNLPRSAIWKKDHSIFRGRDLERWCAKFATGNVFSEENIGWKATNSKPREIPLFVLEFIFNDHPLKWPMGFYSLVGKGDEVPDHDFVGINTLVDPISNEFFGCIISLRHIFVLMWFGHDDPAGHTFRSSYGFIVGPDPDQRQPFYHPKRFQIAAKGKISGAVDLEWD